MLIDDLNNVKKGDQMNEHVLKCFTESEKQMAYQMNLIEIEGKRGTVPVLLTSEMIDLMKFILKFRTENKINPENVHFFPGALDSLKAIRGDAVLRKYTLQAGLKEFMSTTMLLLNLQRK
uniref:Uncharacterized protein n=1 Tax=Cacopsylla melanoneura TaxID=428564 RepID=A0A8D8TRI2_9HEMI